MFLKNMGLAKILLLNILLVVFVVIIILGTLWIYDEYATFHKEAGRMRLEYIESQKTMIKEEVSQIVDYVEYIRPHHKDIEKQIQSEVLGWINEFRYGENGYIFVNTFKGITLAHYKKENIGKNRIDLTDSNGVRINEELINVSKNPDGGYVDYVGTIKPDTNEPASKIGYAQSIDDWQWSIGTGVYVDDIEVIIAEKRAILQKGVRTQVLQIAVVLSAMIVLAILFAIFFSRKVKRESTVFTSFFKEAVAGNKQVDTSELSIQEFKIIGDHANSMLLAKDEVERARRHVEEELREYREHLEELIKERTGDLEEKAVELEQANIRLQELDKLKSMFIDSMSHELRTPLNSIIGFTGILLMGLTGELTEEQRKHLLTMVKTSANHLLALINDVIDLSKIEGGKLEPLIEEFDLPLEMPEGLVIKSDERRVKQIMVNLVGNAVKFTEEGEIEIKVVKKDEKVEVSVRDTGIGIKKEHMGMLFKAFSQITIEGRPKEGTGLGLYLSKKIADLLGGRISVESEFGKGSE
ncbi:MAG: cache domain-containing protein [Deltaproteobacteria bacterium]|nr:cache domain-containing protein [Deltaproteobacteria bacterium]